MRHRGSETIAAISTAVSESGIGIVRMSGEDALTIADRVFRGKNNKKLSEQKTYTIHYGYVMDGEETIDEVLAMILKGPASYTGEDTVEFDCHGGIYVVKKVLELLLKSGARPAEPGEFTKRAFLNGRIDLSQAEAVIDIIQSKNEYALKSSISQLKGSVKKKISNIRNKIIYHTAFIETALDDPEHISVDGYGETLREVLLPLMEEIKKLIDSADDGRVLKEGVQTVILGRPNAGKSSLLNALLGEERAIVTDIAGTTRDVLNESIRLSGITLNLMDTAGIRSTEDVIEKIGVDRAIQYAKEADLIIYVIDSSAPLDENDETIIKLLQDKKSIILLNKSDLEAVVDKDQIKKTYFISQPIIEISAKHGQGIEELEKTLKDMFYHGELSFNTEIYITNARQKAALTDAYESLSAVITSIDRQMPEDFYTIDLMDAYESLGTITGETIGDDLADEIFSKFCMGK